MVSKDELKEIFWPTLITIVAFVGAYFFWINSTYYKDEINRQTIAASHQYAIIRSDLYNKSRMTEQDLNEWPVILEITLDGKKYTIYNPKPELTGGANE